MAKTRRARVDAENSHRRITRSCLRIIGAETQGYPTSHLRAQSGTVEYDRGSREVGYETAMIPGGCWLWPIEEEPEAGRTIIRALKQRAGAGEGGSTTTRLRLVTFSKEALSRLIKKAGHAQKV